MRTKAIYYVTFLLLMVSAFSISGCSKLFGPSDAEVIKAINETGLFKDFTMQSPITILEKHAAKNDTWAVKVSVVFTYETTKGHTSPPMKKTLIFYMNKAKDSAGHSVWKAKLGT
jgi:hypothetical protein